MTFYQHQQELINLQPKSHLLAWETGTGKTLTAIKLAERSESRYVLVVAPKSLVPNWRREIDKWSSYPDDFEVISKENFRRDWDKIKYKRCVIFDEFHYFSGIKSQMSKNAIKYMKKWRINFVYGLTATPYLSTPWNIYVLAKILGHDWNYAKFKKHFFFDANMGGRKISMKRPGMESEIAKCVQMLGSTKTMVECVDVPETIFLEEHFELTTEQKKGIKQIDEFLPIVLYTKEHQICGGVLDGVQYKSEKIERLIDITNQHKKVVIVCRYNAEIEMLRLKIPSMRLVYTINGTVKNKQEIIDQVNESDDCVLIVNAACSEGYNLRQISTMIFYSYDYSLKNYVQMIGRIQRIDLIQRCKYISLIMKGTVDEAVYNSVMAKKSFDAEIYNKERQAS